MTTEEEAEDYDAAVRVAKANGCICIPKMTRRERTRTHLSVSLRHQPTCTYDPMRPWKPVEEVDHEALAKRAAAAKKARQKLTRKVKR